MAAAGVGAAIMLPRAANAAEVTESDVSIKAMIIDKVPMRLGTIHQKLSKFGLYQFRFTMMSFDG